MLLFNFCIVIRPFPASSLLDSQFHTSIFGLWPEEICHHHYPTANCVCRGPSASVLPITLVCINAAAFDSNSQTVIRNPLNSSCNKHEDGPLNVSRSYLICPRILNPSHGQQPNVLRLMRFIAQTSMHLLVPKFKLSHHQVEGAHSYNNM